MTQNEFLENLNTRQNEYYNKDITLKEGETWCSFCKGKGIPIPYNSGICPKCFGEGKLDWVTNIMWKKNINNVGTSSNSFGTSGNVAFGYQAGLNISSGSKNIAMGSNSFLMEQK